MDIPVKTKHLYIIYTMLAQRLRRWANIVSISDYNDFYSASISQQY